MDVLGGIPIYNINRNQELEMSNEMAKRARDPRELIPVITLFTFAPFVSHKNTTIRDPTTEFLVRVALQ